MDESSGVALELKTGVPTYQVEDEEGRIHLLIHLPIEEENEDRWCLWRPDQAGFDSRSIFDRALVEEKKWHTGFGGNLYEDSLGLRSLKSALRSAFIGFFSREVFCLIRHAMILIALVIFALASSFGSPGISGMAQRG
jgi:hypothetical protein